jgi:serine protease AprX
VFERGVFDGGWRRRKQRIVARLGVIGVASVLALAFAGISWGASTYSPVLDVNSMYNTTLYSGAQAYWKAGYTGKGVDVAVIDSGVAPVPGLDVSGKVIYGPDLSFESQASNLRNLDTYGHGTFLAGIIAGRGSGAKAGRYAGDTTNFLGMAPDARIVSLKVATADGATDVSQVIAAIDWVIQHKNDNGLNIRVLNLSYGTDSGQDYTIDPLAYAVEQAWKAGIFVVAATGNDGFVAHTGSLTDPAFDPNIFAVGATDSMSTTPMADDTVASFSSTGSSSRYVDVVAPGSHIVSLRVPGSYIDRTYGSTGYVSPTLFRGSGTSEAAAVASGAAALLIQQHPDLTPDYLKNLFLQNSQLLNGFSTAREGRGEINLAQLLTATPQAPSNSWGRIAASTGAGLLDLSRGSVDVVSNGVILTGEQDIFGKPFDSTGMAAAEAAGSSWSGGIWNGSTWSGSSWSGSSWSGSSWSGSSWSGSSWSSIAWSSNTWSGSSWSGSSWSGSSWSGSTWSGSSWSTGSWQGASWD